MNKPGYVIFHLPNNSAVAEKLDVLTELGLLDAAIESRKDSLTLMERQSKAFQLRNLLEEHFSGLEITESFLEDKDWNREWIEGFKAVKINPQLWIVPPWREKELPENAGRIIINPANAFGTGTHESTQLVLEMLPGLLKNGDHVLDLGCGSGILSIAARKLGAASVRAVDLDPDISDNFMENLQRNHMDHISLQIADVLQMKDYKCDLALINIQKHIILPLLDRFQVAKESPERVILAGLLKEHFPDTAEALRQKDYEICMSRDRGEWVAVSAKRRRKDE